MCVSSITAVLLAASAHVTKRPAAHIEEVCLANSRTLPFLVKRAESLSIGLSQKAFSFLFFFREVRE